MYGRCWVQYDGGINTVMHHLGNLIMRYQRDTEKLEIRWRGTYVVSVLG